MAIASLVSSRSIRDLRERSEYWESAVPPAHPLWEELSHLTAADFPLRIFFLDKSASMRFDPFTYQALCFATYKAITPQHGSSLTFLLASPGETQVTFRRPGDETTGFTIECGSATWYNEPIFRILDAMAPKVEALDIASWSRLHGEPPVQVFCVTDGMDNLSPPHLSQLADLVESIKKIVGPEGNNELYRPMADPQEKCLEDEVVGSSAAKVPVWLVWLAMGSGGKQFLKSCKSVPKEVAIVDAVIPQNQDWQKGGFLLPDSLNAGFEVGDHVKVLPPAWIRESGVPSLMDPHRPREGIISHLPSAEFPKYTILYEDEVEEVGVEPERLGASSPTRGRWMPPGTMEAMSLVQAAVLQPALLLRIVDPESRIVNIWNRTPEPAEVLKRAGIEVMSEDDLKVACCASTSVIGMTLAVCSPPPGFLQNFMEAVGPAARRLDATGRRVACAIMNAALKSVAQGCVVYSAHLYEEFHQSRQSIPDREALTEESVTAWMEAHCKPTLDAMSFLVSEQVLSVQQVIIDCQQEECHRCKETKQQAFAFDGSRPHSVAALSAVCQLTSPDWDGLGRCWERYRHMNPSLASAQPREQVVLRKRPLHDAARLGSARRSNSTSALMRYSRRSAPVLWGAGETLVSSQAVCSGPRSFRRLSNRSHSKGALLSRPQSPSGALALLSRPQSP
mmetsp:Transcript_57961/g.102921  ORF Transcript_57961/g.102921 Transcript_57961/m.102921 type:complete len:678 (-) Transcript_57961:181-2214(-)